MTQYVQIEEGPKRLFFIFKRPKSLFFCFCISIVGRNMPIPMPTAPILPAVSPQRTAKPFPDAEKHLIDPNFCVDFISGTQSVFCPGNRRFRRRYIYFRHRRRLSVASPLRSRALSTTAESIRTEAVLRGEFIFGVGSAIPRRGGRFRARLLRTRSDQQSFL